MTFRSPLGISNVLAELHREHRYLLGAGLPSNLAATFERILHSAALAMIHGAMLGDKEQALLERAGDVWRGIEPLIRR